MKKFEDRNQKHPSGRPIRNADKKSYAVYVPSSRDPLTLGLRREDGKSAIGFVHKFTTEEDI